MSNEEKDASELPEEAKEAWDKVDVGRIAIGVVQHGVCAELMSGGADDGRSEVVHEHKSWSHHVMEEPEPGSGGRVRRTLRRWFGR